MKEIPILFSAPMVQALRADRKTQTRRTRGLDKINAEPDAWRYHGFNVWTGETTPSHKFMRDGLGHAVAIRCPYGVAGDRLWTRETFQPIFAEGTTLQTADWETGKGYAIVYPATDPIVTWIDGDDKITERCKPSIHMPRWASRDTLEVVSTRPERLQDITEADAKAEGVKESRCGQSGYAMEPMYSYRTGFVRVWHDINGAGSWAKNPWVWRVEFRRLNGLSREMGK